MRRDQILPRPWRIAVAAAAPCLWISLARHALVSLAVCLLAAAWSGNDRLAERLRPSAARWAFGLLLLFVFGYNLLPARVWQRQMRANSKVRREVLALVYAASTTSQPSVVLLQDFPARFDDRPLALQTLAGIADARIVRGDVAPVDGSLVIAYRGGRPAVLRL